MKSFITIILTTISSGILLTVTAYAHDPALHKKENAEKPKCEAMANMDHSTMDANDPIMQAMMKQCAGNNSNHHKDIEHHEDKDVEKHSNDDHHG